LPGAIPSYARWLCALLIVGCPLARATGMPEPSLLRYRDERLTVRLDRVPLDEVLELFARETGAEIHGEAADLREVTKRFDSVPLPEALHRLLGAQNFVMRYGGDGRLLAVDLLDAPQPARKLQKAAPSPLLVYRLFTTHRPVTVTGRLATAVGTPNARLPQLLDVALQNGDAGTRRRALQKMLGVLEGDATFRATALSTLRSTPDAAVLDFLRERAGARAAELLDSITADATDGYVRARAWRLLAFLRRSRPAAVQASERTDRILEASRSVIGLNVGAARP
jgi:hypothetical protein